MKKIALALLVFATTTSVAQRKSNPVLDSLRNEKDVAVLQQKLARLANGTEQDMLLLINFYGNDAAKTDSLIKVAVERYPAGQMAFIQATNRLYVEPSAIKQEEMFRKIKQRFANRDLDQHYYSVAYAYALAKNVPKVLEYLKPIKNDYFRAAATRLNAEKIMEYNLPAAEKMVRSEIDQVLKAGVPPAADLSAGGPRGEARASYFAFLNTYGRILQKSGKYAEALKYTKEAYEGATKKDDVVTGNYAFLLNKNGNHQEAFPLLENLVKTGKGSAGLKTALMESYSKLNPGKDAKAYMASLEEGMKVHIKEEVAKMLVDEAAPNFAVKDITGKTVSLADFKGKTIVLDFWATWCGPCKKSFPAMQMAVNRYRNDPNVKFLFIHTWEKVEDPLTDAKNYLKDNSYSFDLYMDTKDAKTKANEAVTAFGVKGIPAKFVIDGKGKIRFKMMGFSGGDDAAVAELSAMIEMSKGI